MLVTPHLKTVLKDYQHSAVKSLHGPAHHLHPPFAPPPPPSPINAAVASGAYEESARSPAAGGGASTIAGAAAAAAANAAAANTNTTTSSSSPTAAYVPPLPVQQLPILTTSDTSSSDLSFTPLEDVSISCFSVGGEKRLCLPQVLQSVLGDFTLAQINNQCDNLLIYCSRCTHEQLNVLKGQAILPSSAFSCGLITKSDAERLCSALLHAPSPAARGAKPAALRIKREPPTTTMATSAYAEQNGDAPHKNVVSVKTEDGGGAADKDAAHHQHGANGARITTTSSSSSPPPPRARAGRVFRVRHECFGRAVGTLHAALYVAKQAKCIECVECKGWYSPQQFVKHVHWQHARGESQTVHWGFDSAKWRHYLLPLVDAAVAASTATAAAVVVEDAPPVAGGADACCSRSPPDDADRVLDLMRDRYEGVVPFAVYEGGGGGAGPVKAEIKKEVVVNGAAKGWNMPLKRKLLHQAAKSATTPPPRPPATPPPPPPPIMKRDTSSPALAIKKSKLAMSGEDYMLMAQSYLQPSIEPYLQTAAVFQQFPLPFPYAALPPHALPLAVVGGGCHPSAKEAKLRQAIAESNADLAGGGEVVAAAVRDTPLPPTPKKQRLIRHMQEQQQQRRRLELEVQKSPDSTSTILPTAGAATTTSATMTTTPPAHARYSEIDLSTTDTEDTASEGTAPAAPPRRASPPAPAAAGSLDEVERLLHAHPHADRIVGVCRRLRDECDAKDARIRALEAQLEALQRLQGERLSLPADDEAALAGAADEQVQIDHASVITTPARPSVEHETIVVMQSCGGGGVDADTATSTSSGSDDAKPHCPPASATATAAT